MKQEQMMRSQLELSVHPLPILPRVVPHLCCCSFTMLACIGFLIIDSLLAVPCKCISCSYCRKHSLSDWLSVVSLFSRFGTFYSAFTSPSCPCLCPQSSRMVFPVQSSWARACLSELSSASSQNFTEFHSESHSALLGMFVFAGARTLPAAASRSRCRDPQVRFEPSFHGSAFHKHCEHVVQLCVDLSVALRRGLEPRIFRGGMRT